MGLFTKKCQVCKKPLKDVKDVKKMDGYKFCSTKCQKRYQASKKKGICEFC